MMHDRVNTRSLLKRKGFFMNNYDYILCQQNTDETLVHLCWNGKFAQDRQSSIIPNRRRATSIYDDSLLASRQLPKQTAMDMIIIGCWSIQMRRHGNISKNVSPKIGSWRHLLKEYLNLLGHRMKRKHSACLQIWIDTYL